MWRQSRIFTSIQTSGWYFQLLSDLVKPWRNGAAAQTNYFFTRYFVPAGMDDADTEIAHLPPLFLQNTAQYGPIHRSLRLRYFEPPVGGPQPPAGVVPQTPPLQAALEQLMQAYPGRYWRYDFRDYAIGDDLGGSRFSNINAAQAVLRTVRGKKYAAVLQANCDFALEILQPGQIETNANENNLCLRTPVQSLLHLLNNVWWDETGESPQLWAHSDVRNLKMKV
jgi:hypothetical protein